MNVHNSWFRTIACALAVALLTSTIARESHAATYADLKETDKTVTNIAIGAAAVAVGVFIYYLIKNSSKAPKPTPAPASVSQLQDSPRGTVGALPEIRLERPPRTGSESDVACVASGPDLRAETAPPSLETGGTFRLDLDSGALATQPERVQAFRIQQ
jgi:hypothetical protein